MAASSAALSPSPPSRPWRERHRVVAALLARPSVVGLAAGLYCWWRSLSPTLMPRSWLTQAGIGAVSFGFGYLVGTLLSRLAHWFLRWFDAEPGPRLRRGAWWALAAVAVLAVVVGAVLWRVWQDDQRAVLAMDPLAAAAPVPMLVLTVVLLAVLFLIGRLIGHAVRRIDGFVTRFVPRPVAVLVTAVFVGGVTVTLAQDVVFQSFSRWADARFGALDQGTEAGVVQPTSASVSGSPASLAPWESLGFQGRTFVASATPVTELQATARQPAQVREPIRVYAGLETAEDLDDRVQVVIDELERTGAADRSVLVVTTTTGTGWVNPAAATAIEHLWQGDTAIAGLQYSYLPSWIAFLVGRDVAKDAGVALNEGVHRWWSALPADDRPQLVVYGESLGSFGAEAAFAGEDAATSVANLTGRSDGVLFAGPTESNAVWRQILAGRDAGSPVWQPVFEGGRQVRSAVDRASVPPPDQAGWERSRVLYLHHASDPVGLWSWQTLWSPPAWMDHPRGPDVPSRGSWFPFVTFAQEVADLMAGFSAPPGHGHDYTPSFVAGFAAVAPPEGWTPADTARLEQAVAADT